MSIFPPQKLSWQSLLWCISSMPSTIVVACGRCLCRPPWDPSPNIFSPEQGRCSLSWSPRKRHRGVILNSSYRMMLVSSWHETSFNRRTSISLNSVYECMYCLYVRTVMRIVLAMEGGLCMHCRLYQFDVCMYVGRSFLSAALLFNILAFGVLVSPRASLSLTR